LALAATRLYKLPPPMRHIDGVACLVVEGVTVVVARGGDPTSQTATCMLALAQRTVPMAHAIHTVGRLQCASQIAHRTQHTETAPCGAVATGALSAGAAGPSVGQHSGLGPVSTIRAWAIAAWANRQDGQRQFAWKVNIAHLGQWQLHRKLRPKTAGHGGGLGIAKQQPIGGDQCKLGCRAYSLGWAQDLV
jgi:hypothetical protein